MIFSQDTLGGLQSHHYSILQYNCISPPPPAPPSYSMPYTCPFSLWIVNTQYYISSTIYLVLIYKQISCRFSSFHASICPLTLPPLSPFHFYSDSDFVMFTYLSQRIENYLLFLPFLFQVICKYVLKPYIRYKRFFV